VIVSPVDSTFNGQWHIQSDSTISIKHLSWMIKELLQGSKYSERFNGGTFMHASLGPSDYHRQHAPVDGTVVEARVIKDQVYLKVTVKDGNRDKPQLDLHRNFNALDHVGYQFCQMRGLIVLDTPIGLVAVLPINMAQVLSVIVMAEVGKTLRKGEKLLYFQFRGSDIVLVFEVKSKVKITAKRTHHYRIGGQIASAELAD